MAGGNLTPKLPSDPKIAVSPGQENIVKSELQFGFKIIQQLYLRVFHTVIDWSFRLGANYSVKNSSV